MLDKLRDIVCDTHAECATIHMNVTVQEKYNGKYFEELSIRQQRKKLHCDTPKLESRDDGSTISTACQDPIPKMTFHVGDVTEGLGFPNESFDLIICKKTLDVILCSVGSVTNAKSMMNECFRLLNKEHGVMMILSSAKPEDRAYYFEQDPWSGIENIKLPTMDQSFEQKTSHERFVNVETNYLNVFDKCFSPPDLTNFTHTGRKLIPMHTSFTNRVRVFRSMFDSVLEQRLILV